jgi:pimeloyl-ACP methyl ester carboxylesterase
LFTFRSIEAMAEHILASAAPRFALCGHSMGGRVAIEVYRRAPNRVDRLALLDTGTHPTQSGEAEKRLALVNLARTQGMSALALTWLPPMVHPDLPRDGALMTALFAMVERMSPEIFENQVTALLNRPNADPVLPSIHCPTLVAVGRQDAWSPVAQHEIIAKAIVGARLRVFEECGHMSTLEAPEAVTSALAEWMRTPQ